MSKVFLKFALTLLAVFITACSSFTRGPASIDEVSKVISKVQKQIIQKRIDNKYWDLPTQMGVKYVSIYYLLKKWNGLNDEKYDDLLDENTLKKYILQKQKQDGSWNGTHDNHHPLEGHLDASIYNYFALKVMGVDPSDERMRKAQEFILKNGGIEKAGLLTKIIMSMFNNYNWKDIPWIPYALFSKASPVHHKKFAQWISPHLMPFAYLRNNRVFKDLGQSYGLPELHKKPFKSTNKERSPSHYDKNLLDKIAKAQDPNGTWGGYPIAALFVVMASEHHHRHTGKLGLDDEVFIKAMEGIHKTMFRSSEEEIFGGIIMDGRYWDTSFMATALAKSGYNLEKLYPSRDYLIAAQSQNGGFPYGLGFEPEPDGDDTSEAIIALEHIGGGKSEESSKKATHWLLEMQNKDGGWGAFSKNNQGNFALNLFVKKFADSADLFDESSADLTGHVLEALGHRKLNLKDKAVKKAVSYLRKTQEKDGSWLGRWGINYIYGTTQALGGLLKVGIPNNDPMVQKAVEWLLSKQNSDGGWGESPKSYDDKSLSGIGYSTPTQTSWTLLALIATAGAEHHQVEAGISYLLNSFYNDSERFVDHSVVGTGHPSVEYMDYPSYPYAFSLMALSAYRKALSAH